MPVVLKESDFGDKNAKDTRVGHFEPDLPEDDPNRAVMAGGPGDPIALEDEGTEELVEDQAKDEDVLVHKPGKPDSADRAKDKEDKPLKHKYADQGEAEKAAKEAERRMHQATEEAAMLRKMIMDQNLKKGSDTPGESERDKIADRAIAEISRLDEKDPEYQLKVGRVWAKAQEEISTLVAGKVRREMEEVGTREKVLVEKVENALREEGMNTKTSQRLFWSLAGQVPANLSSPDDQIEWVIDRMKEIKTSLYEEWEGERDADKERRIKNHVLGTGSRRSPKEKGKGNEPYKPVTMKDQLRMLAKKRALASA